MSVPTRRRYVHQSDIRPPITWWPDQKDQLASEFEVTPAHSCPGSFRPCVHKCTQGEISNSLFTMSDNRQRNTKLICETIFIPGLTGLRSNRTGGARRDRTDDLMLAKHALSQLSYGPLSADADEWWAWEDLNLRPHAYQARALTN